MADADIRQRVEGFAKALRAKDIDAVMSLGQRASGESMAFGWLCTITRQSQQTSSMARLF